MAGSVEERLVPSDTFYNLIKNAPFGVYLVDSEFRLAEVSAGAEQVFSQIPRPLLGRDFNEVLRHVWPEPFASEALDRFHHTMATGEPFHSADTTERRRDIEAVESYDWQLARVLLPNGRYGVVCYFYDMTAHRAAERALRESEERYRAVADNQIEMVCRFTLDGKILYVNAAYAARRNTTPEDLRDCNFWDFIPPEEHAGVRALMQELSPERREVQIENRFETSSGARWTLWTNRALTFDKHGKVLEAQSTGVDITDRKLAEEKLRESEERFRSMANTAPFMIWVTEPDGQCSFVSQTWHEFSGQRPDDGLGFGWLDVLHPEDRAGAENAFLEANATRAPFVTEYRLRRAGGAYRWVMNSARPRISQSGEFLGFIGSVVDVHERRETEEHRKLLLDELNHRVKNTLAVVQSIASQTFKRDGDVKAMRQAFEGRLTALASAHSILTATNWERSPLREIVAKGFSMCGVAQPRVRTSGPDITLAPKPAIAIALALHELCTNAMKYGSLSNDAGAVDLCWEVTGESAPVLHMHWAERGGPAVTPPEQRGFGSILIERLLAQDIDGDVRMSFEPSGVTCTIDAPLHSYSSAAVAH